jgi:hypothetical protein
MCLYVNSSKKCKVAKRDIVCYKTMSAVPYVHGVILFSYFQNFRYELGKEYRKPLDKRGLKKFRGLRSVHHEGYHSYTRAPGPDFDQGINIGKRTVLVKCIIPKGSLYHSNKGVRASTAIRVLSVIDWESREELELRPALNIGKGFRAYRKGVLRSANTSRKR